MYDTIVVTRPRVCLLLISSLCNENKLFCCFLKADKIIDMRSGCGKYYYLTASVVFFYEINIMESSSRQPINKFFDKEFHLILSL